MNMPGMPHNMRVRFAVIDSNILTGIGLQEILEDIIPVAEVVLLRSFDELVEAQTEMFAHFFVSSRIYFEHAQYFRNHSTRSIVLVNGDLNISGVKTINVCQSEQNVVRDILALQRGQHGPHGAMPMPPMVMKQKSGIELSAREVEVAVLLSKGFINKEIADRMDIKESTVISHRKNIMEKLKARSLADIIVYSVMNGLVDASEL